MKADEESWERFAHQLDQIDEEKEFGNLKAEDQMKSSTNCWKKLLN